MLIPLKQFICDECGEIINSPGEGYVEWEEGIDQDGQFFAKGFRIVHHLPKSPYKILAIEVVINMKEVFTEAI